MEGSASVRRSLSGTLVPSSVTTVALLQKPEEKTGKISRKVLDEEEYIEVNTWFVSTQARGAPNRSNSDVSVTLIYSFKVWLLTKCRKRFPGLLNFPEDVQKWHIIAIILLLVSLTEFREDHPERLLPRCDQTRGAEGLPGSRGAWWPAEDESHFHSIWIHFSKVDTKDACTLWV